MSNSIDQRIVEMQFDNAQFEKGVATTMKSLQNLDKQLELKNGVKGLKEIDKVASRVDLSGMERNVGKVESVFGALEDTAGAALDSIAAKIANISSSVIQGITIQPLTDGLGEYTTKLNSIQTIQANTMGKSTMRQITDTLDDLNTYADKTIYNFAEMTRNIGTFTAAGVDLKKSQVAIKGIANMAAASGASSYDASRAMYQLSQALSAGSLKLQDWNSVVNANMGGKLFQDALLATSDALGAGGREAVKAAGSFRESLKEGWITQEVLVKTLRNFTLATNEMTEAQKDEARATLEQEGYSKEQIKTIFEQANVAQEAATKVKTFEQLVDTTREALGSGWATTWEYIIGDLDQAKNLWTPISDRLNSLIDGFSSARNDLLRVWNRGSKKLGLESGRDAVLEGLGELVKIADAIVKPISDAWNSVFTAMDPKELYELSVGFKEFATGLRESFEHSSAVKSALSALQTIFTGLFGAAKTVATLFGGALVGAFKAVGTVAKVAFTGIETVAKVISNVFAIAQGAAEKLGKGGFNFFGGIADFLRKNTGLDKNLTNIVESIDRVVDGVGKLFSGKIEEGSTILGKAFSAISKNFESFRKAIESFAGGKVQGFLDFLNNVRANAPAVALKVYTFLTEQFKKLQPLLDPIAKGMENVGTSLVLAFDAFKGLLSGAIFDTFGSKIANAFASITDFTDLSQLERLGGQLKEAFQSLFGSIGDEFRDFFGKFYSGLNLEGSPLEGVFSFFENLGSRLQGVWGALGALTTGLTGGDPFAFFKSFIDNIKNAFTGVDFSQLDENVSGASGMAEKLAAAASAIKGTVHEMAADNPFEKLGTYLANVANSLSSGLDAFLSKINLDSIKEIIGILASFGVSAGLVVSLYTGARALDALADTLDGFGDIIQNIGKLTSELKGFVKAKKMAVYADAFKSVAIAIGIMVAATAAIAIIGPDKMLSAVPVVLALVGMLAAITVLFGALAKLERFDFGSMFQVATSMLAVAVAIGILAITIAAFNAIGGGSWTGIAQIAILMGMLYLLAKGMSGMNMAGVAALGSSMMSISLSLLVMYAAIRLLGTMDTGVLVKGVAVISALLLVVGIMGRLMGSGTKSISISSSSSMTANLLGVAALIFVCYEVIKGLSIIPPEQAMSAVKVLLVIALVITTMTVVASIASAFAKGAAGSGVALLLTMSVVIGVLAIAITNLGLALGSGVDVWGGLLVIALGLAAMTAAIAVLGKIAPELSGVVAAMLGMSIAIAAFTAVVMILSNVPWETVLSGIINVSMILGVFLLALLGIGAIGMIVGPGLELVGAAFWTFGVAMVAVAAALLIGVVALAAFTAISGAFIPAFERFTMALVALFKTEDFVGSMIGMSVAMALLGAACLILGIGLGALSLAIWAFGEVFPRAVMTVTAAIMQLTAFFTANKDAIATGITNMLDAGVQGIAGFLGKFLEAGGNLVKSISEGLANHTGDIRNGVAGVITTLGNLLWEGITTLGPILLELLGGLASGILEGIANVVTGPIEWLNDKVYEFTGGLMGVAPQAKESAEEIATQTAEGLASKDEELGASTKAKIDELDAHIREKAPEAGEASQEMATAITNPFEQTGGKFDFFKAFGLDDATLAGGFDTVKAFFQGKGIELPDELITQFASGASGFDAWEMIQSNGNVDMSQFEDLMGEGAIAGADTFTGQFDERMNDVDIMAIVANAADIDVDTLKENFSGAAAAAATAFSEGFADNMKLDGTGPMEKAAAALKASSGSMNGAGKTAADAVVRGFSGASKDMRKYAKEAAKDAVAAVKSEGGSARAGGWDVGYNMGAGLKSGLDSGSSYLSARAAQIVRNAIAAMKSAAKESSPSRETIWISEMMMQGMMVGFDNLRDNVAASASGVVTNSLTAMATQAAYVSGLLDDIDDQPTIRPVLDLTDYEAGISRMQGLNASAPMNSAQLANRLSSSTGDAGYYNSNRSMVINLNYGAGTSAADMVNEMAMILQTKNLMEA